MLDFAGTDTEGEGAERAMSRSMAVAAHDGHPRMRQTEFGSDNVDDTLLDFPEVEEPDTEVAAILAHHLDLYFRVRVSNGQRTIGRRDVMVQGRKGALRAADFAASERQSLKGLR